MNDTRTITTGYGAIATALAALVVYAGSLANGYAFDDVVLIPNDPRVVELQLRALLTKTYWNDAALGLYRPLTSVSFALDWLVSSGKPAWFHFTNMVWHAIASVLAYALLSRFFQPAGALIGGLLFALHPLHAEAVANIVGRSEMMAATFFLAACIAWDSRTLSFATRVVLSALCYALALFSKESAVVLPGVLLLIDLVRRERPRWADYAVMLAVFAAFMIIRWQVVGGLTPSRVDPSLELTRTVGDRIVTAFQAWPIYLKLMLFPLTLLADYGPRILLPLSEWSPLAVVGLTLAAASVIGGIVALLRGERMWALGLLWFPITILPVSNFIVPIGVIVAERTLYLPMFAICIGAAALFSRDGHAITQLRNYAFIVLALFAVRTAMRVPDWKSTDTIMAALLRDRPDAFRGHWHMARVARTRGDVAAALTSYDRAVRLWPYREALVQETAVYASSQGQEAWARVLALRGAQRWPANVHFHRILAAYALDHGDAIAARQILERARQLHPNDQMLNDMWRALTGAR